MFLLCWLLTLLRLVSNQQDIFSSHASTIPAGSLHTAVPTLTRQARACLRLPPILDWFQEVLDLGNSQGLCREHLVLYCRWEQSLFQCQNVSAEESVCTLTNVRFEAHQRCQFGSWTGILVLEGSAKITLNAQLNFVADHSLMFGRQFVYAYVLNS